MVGSSALASAPPDSPAALLGVWAAAVAILFLASLLPAAMVPAIRGVVQLSTTVLVSGVLASATIVSGTISGASSGARYGRPGTIHGGLEGLAAGHLGAAGRIRPRGAVPWRRAATPVWPGGAGRPPGDARAVAACVGPACGFGAAFRMRAWGAPIQLEGGGPLKNVS